MATEDKLSLPPLLPKDQKELDQLQKNGKRLLPKWTGLRGKTLWDWLQIMGIIAIPVVVTIVTLWFSVQQNHDFQLAQAQHQNDLRIAQDQQQQATLETYLDQMSGLLLDKNLSRSGAGSEVQALARARTETALRILDPTRKGLLLLFLYEAHLIDRGGPKVNLSGLHLNQLRLNNVDLHGADLSRAFLDGADLSFTDLSGADLSYTDFDDADLRGVRLPNANLSYAVLRRTNLSCKIDPEFQVLRCADLSNANLEGADLSGATMPDGTKHP
jgi:uncharacterized protein YjbI with pentapeptide repeats